jgi:hypothetical protein
MSIHATGISGFFAKLSFWPQKDSLPHTLLQRFPPQHKRMKA